MFFDGSRANLICLQSRPSLQQALCRGRTHHRPGVALPGRLAREKRSHNRYSCGLDHLAWVADSRADVDRMHQLLLEIGAIVLDPPTDYPHYREGYYAVFLLTLMA